MQVIKYDFRYQLRGGYGSGKHQSVGYNKADDERID